jgi:hypothetical protein
MSLTLPHEKQRTGIIMLTARDSDARGAEVVRQRGVGGLFGKSKIGFKNSRIECCIGLKSFRL